VPILQRAAAASVSGIRHHTHQVRHSFRVFHCTTQIILGRRKTCDSLLVCSSVPLFLCNTPGHPRPPDVSSDDGDGDGDANDAV
jgi:hypothetical protein